MPKDYKRVLEAARVADEQGCRWTKRSWRPRMGEATGFMKYDRELPRRRSVPVRLRDWKEVYEPFPDEHLQTQAARCMDCGIPFCHTGCPLGNLIPEWNDLVYREDWHEAIERLHATNNFPEFTGRLCPAPCEAACVLGINEDPVAIKQVEVSIVDHGWEQGEIAPVLPTRAHRQAGRGRRLRSGRARRRAAAHPRRSRGRRSSSAPTASAGCCATASPSSRWRSGSSTAGSSRCAPRAPSSGSTRTSARTCRSTSCSALRRDRARRRRDGLARPADPRARAPRHLPGDGVPAAGEPGAGGRPRRAPVLGGGQARRDHRRRRHRRRLPRHRAPPRCASVHQFEILPRPPDARPDANPWPTWPLIYRTVVRARGGRRARVLRSTPSASSATTTATCARCGPTRSSRSSSTGG